MAFLPLVTKDFKDVTTASEHVLMSAFSLQPVLDAAQSSFHLFKTGLTAMCGSKLDYGVPLVMAPTVVRLTGR